MKLIFQIARLPLLAAALLLVYSQGATAQTSPIIPIPFVNNFAGVAPGSTNTACSASVDIPNTASPVAHYGDGCIATQATLTTLYDTAVDPQGNVFFTERSQNYDLRVVYNGGTLLAQALIAANPQIPNFIPLPGHVYTLAGGPVTGLKAQNGVYYCGNVIGGIQGLDTTGNGCPGAYSWLEPGGIAIDQYGNVFSTNIAKYPSVRVIYFGGAQVANLITLMNPTVTAPQVGYIYQIAGGSPTKGVFGDGGLANAAGFLVPRYLAVDSAGNIYVSDATGASGGTTASGANVREINGTTGIITTVAGENTCGQTAYNSAAGCPFGSSGDGGPAAGALFNLPYELALDQNNNLFILDSVNARVRVLYRGGTIAGISNPVVGNVYTYAGGGSSTANGTLAQAVMFGSVKALGIDRSGNVYVLDPTTPTTANPIGNVIWKFDATTGIGNIIAGPGTSAGSAKTGVFCNKGTAGPTVVRRLKPIRPVRGISLSINLAISLSHRRLRRFSDSPTTPSSVLHLTARRYRNLWHSKPLRQLPLPRKRSHFRPQPPTSLVTPEETRAPRQQLLSLTVCACST